MSAISTAEDFEKVQKLSRMNLGFDSPSPDNFIFFDWDKVAAVHFQPAGPEKGAVLNAGGVILTNQDALDAYAAFRRYHKLSPMP